MVTFELNENAALTAQERTMLEEAKKRPIIYDDDSPQMDDAMEKAFIAARKKKPYYGEPLTLYVSKSTIEKVQDMGPGCIAILGKLFEKAVDEYHAI